MKSDIEKIFGAKWCSVTSVLLGFSPCSWQLAQGARDVRVSLCGRSDSCFIPASQPAKISGWFMGRMACMRRWLYSIDRGPISFRAITGPSDIP